MTANDELIKYAKENQKFLSLSPGESYVGYFTGFKRIPDRWKISEDPNATTVVYTLKDKNGKVLEWTKSSGKVAIQMAEIPINSGVSILMVKKGEYLIKAIPGTMPKKVATETVGEEVEPVMEESEEAPF